MEVRYEQTILERWARFNKFNFGQLVGAETKPGSRICIGSTGLGAKWASYGIQPVL